jgi:pantothenate kinase
VLAEVTIDPSLVERAQRLVVPGRRALLGVCGAPGAGKSTLAEALVAALAPAAVLVPMDGFHLANVQLRRLGRLDRKGAPDTFDPSGYLSLLRRLAGPEPGTIYAPEFRREIEEPIAGAISISSDVPLVVTEGNYLLLDSAPWSQVQALMAEVWFVEVDEAVRRQRLIERHIRYGRSPAEAAAFADGSDQRNAELIAITRARADLIVAG